MLVRVERAIYKVEGIGRVHIGKWGDGALASGGCSGSLNTPVVPWADGNQYWLAAGGSFEDSSSSWVLAGGAAISSSNEAFHVINKSLSTPAGGSGTTPSICITALSPLMRFLAAGGNAASPLKVEVIAPTPFGVVRKQIASVAATASWTPTPSSTFWLASARS